MPRSKIEIRKSKLPLILASASPRRAELLTAAGYAVTVRPCHIEEPTRRPDFIPVDLWPMALAFIKAHHVQSRLRDLHATIVGADTIVVLDGQILGKPTSVGHARQMLTQLSGRQHLVLTGIALLRGRQQRTALATSVCKIKRLSPAWLEPYLASDLWQGKAGAYGIQDDGHDPFVTLVSGEWSNVVGLPMELLKTELRALQ